MQAQQLSLFQDQRVSPTKNTFMPQLSPRGENIQEQIYTNVEEEDEEYECEVQETSYDSPRQEAPLAPPSPSKDSRNKWVQSHLLDLSTSGQSLVDFDCVDDRLLLLFDDLTL
mmetsp:Transcript_39859/g.29415  ORF Transcript_39859/g.29415 Transcript_39859/m.29415 type:complete len:113 (-) Transcript_39859:868-1206(-)